MISSTREGEEFSDKPDNGPSSNPTNPDVSSSSAWLRSKDPRIVRVSRAFGGKDRHSKVCTIRGLRDRRVRLTVPTALQLYDLQARLGLNQPSKVVDWLLNVAKDDIDELPPLQIPPGFNFIDQAHQAMLSTSSNRQELGSKMNPSWEDDSQKSNSLTRSPPRSTKSKHAVAAAMENLMWIKHMSGGEQRPETLESGHGGGRGGMQVGSSSDFIPRSNNHSTLPSFIQNVLPYGPYHHFDYPTNFSLSSPSSQSEDHHHHHHHQHHHHHLNNFNLLHSGPPHVLVSPPAGMPSQSYFPTSTAAPMELDPRHFINHFQLLSPTQQQDMSLDDVSRSKR